MANQVTSIETDNGKLAIKAGHATPWGTARIIHELSPGVWFIGTDWIPDKKRSRDKHARIMDLLSKGECKQLFVAPLLPHGMASVERGNQARAFANHFGFRSSPGIGQGFPVVLSPADWPATIPCPEYAVCYRPEKVTPHWRDAKMDAWAREALPTT